MPRHWLMKTEPDVYSIHDLEAHGTTFWDGIRNYQARNYMRAMELGDKVLVYHSNAEPPGAAGIATVSGLVRPDATAFDRKNKYYDERSTPDRPLWDAVDLEHHETFATHVGLDAIKQDPNLTGMMLTSGKAMRLSIQPVDERHFEHITRLGRAGTTSTASPTTPSSTRKGTTNTANAKPKARHAMSKTRAKGPGKTSKKR